MPLSRKTKFSIKNVSEKFKKSIQAGIEPAIFCSVGKRVLHCATGPLILSKSFKLASFILFVINDKKNASVSKISIKHACLVSIIELRMFGGLLGFSSELAKGNGLVLGASG